MAEVALRSGDDGHEAASAPVERIEPQGVVLARIPEPRAVMPPRHRAAPEPRALPLPSLEDSVAELVAHLLRPVLEKTSEKKVLLAKNLTYQDTGLESEMTKHLSGIVNAKLKGQGRIELLSPGDVDKAPDSILLGEMWETEDGIDIRLRLIEGDTRRAETTVALQLEGYQLPPEKDVSPPPVISLDVIQRVIALMNRVLPGGGDFQLNVWPEKDDVHAVYREGDYLVVNVKAAKDSHIYMDYYTVTGKVVHLLPNHLKGGEGRAKKGEKLVVGEKRQRGKQLRFKVSAPFGEELLVVVASDKAFAPRPKSRADLIEQAEPYAKKFGARLKEKKEKGTMAGGHFIIITKARKGEG